MTPSGRSGGVPGRKRRSRGLQPGVPGTARRAIAASTAALAAGLAVFGIALRTEGPLERQVFLFSGRGLGHGVGMPQYGAFGAALAGWDAQRILHHYYRGTELETAAPADVRVLLEPSTGSVAVSSAGAWSAVDEASGRRTALDRGSRYLAVARPGGADLITAGGTGVARFSGPFRIEPQGPEPRLTAGVREYRGQLRVLPAGEGLEVVNVVDLEDYLAGVVPREMPPSWGDRAPAALEAQAIAARSYALATRVRGASFDAYDDERSQVYGGLAAEDRRTTAAVRRTRGRILTYRGRVVTAYFSSSSGGHTEDGRNVFPGGGAQPYLTGVPDPFDGGSPYHRWPEPAVFTGGELAQRVHLPMAVSRVDILRRGRSPRVLAARAVTPFRARELSGADLRAELGLPDTWFSITTWRLTEDGAAVAPPERPARGEVALVILNGTSRSGLAGRTAARAESLGYPAVAAANAPSPAEVSTVYHRPGASGAAREVGNDLGIARSRELPERGPLAHAVPAYAHVAVVLGGMDGEEG